MTAVGVFVVWLACRPEPLIIEKDVVSKPDAGHPSVIIISIDTLRADHLSCYGYRRKTSPLIDRFAKDSVLYENALSPSTWTLPGHASIFTGNFPLQHAAHFVETCESCTGDRAISVGVAPPATPLHQDHLTLAEILEGNGYRTAAIVSNFAYFHPDFGLNQGFQFHDYRARRLFGYEPILNSYLKYVPHLHNQITKPYRSATEINDVTFRWLESGNREPFFLFLNYMEPHQPYSPPSPHYTAFTGTKAFMDPRLKPGGQMQMDEDDRDHFIALYDGEIAYVDAEVGTLLTRLKKMGIYDEALIVVTSDHGEFFGEHDLWEHTCGPYEPVHRVPLIVKYPNSESVGVEHSMVQTIDILPTILEYAGIPVPAGIQGTSLRGRKHAIMTEQYVNTYLARQFGGHLALGYKSYYEAPWKLVVYSDGEVRLYDLDRDPHENRDLSNEETIITATMQSKLADLVLSLTSTAPVKSKTGELDDETVRRLRALGYVQ